MNKWRTKVICGALAACLTMPLTACGGGTPSASGKSGVVRIGHDQPIENWDPVTQSTPTYLFMVYDPLLRRSENGLEVDPNLVTDWELTQEQITLHLREDVSFTDGERFDADAVIANFERLQTVPSNFRNIVDNFQEMSTTGEYSLTITLKEPQPNLPYYLSTEMGVMISPKALADGSFVNTPVGTGPFVYDADKSIAGTKTVVTRNPDYWDADNVGVQSIEYNVIDSSEQRYNALRTGDLDIIQDTVGRSAEQAEKQGYDLTRVSATIWALTFFDTEGVFKDPLVREAVCTAVNGQDWLNVSFNGVGNALPTNTFAFPDADVPEFSGGIDRAKELMAQAGNPKLSVSMAASTELLPVYELFKSTAAELGIEVKLDVMPFGQYFTTYNQTKYAVSIFSTRGTDAYAYYLSSFAPESYKNPFGVRYPDLNKIAADALHATDEATADEHWNEMARAIHDQALECGHIELITSWLSNPENVTNVKGTATEIDTLRYKELKTP